MGPPDKQQRPRLTTESAAEDIDHDDDSLIVQLTAEELARHAELMFDLGVTYMAMQCVELDEDARAALRQVWKSPTWAELEKRRQPSDEPCGRRTCRGCSRCIRADAVRRRAVRS